MERLELMRQFPEMYPMRQRGPFVGLRYFVVNRRWLLYYRLEHNRIAVIAIIPAFTRP